MAAWMIPAAILGSSLLGGSSARSAAKTQAAAADRAGKLQREQFERQVELQTPFREAGLRALPELEAASRYTPFGMDQFQADPGYNFRMSEGMKGLERSAAARGGLLSGSMLKGIQRFGQDLGSQEYMNAFNRYQIERNARLNPLQSIMGAGQTATNQLTGAAGQLGQGLAQSYGNLGQAQASGYVGAANAAMGGVQGISNAVQNYYGNQMMAQMLQSQRPSQYGAPMQLASAAPGPSPFSLY
jgi:hypothetical protein